MVVLGGGAVSYERGTPVLGKDVWGRGLHPPQRLRPNVAQRRQLLGLVLTIQYQYR